VLPPLPVLPPAEGPPPPVPVLPPLPPPPVSPFAQEAANIPKAIHMASEAKARLTFTIVLFLAFMSPSRLVFTYSIAEGPQMGKDICEDPSVLARNASRWRHPTPRCDIVVHASVSDAIY
jgi:hypothetical protein